MNSGANGEIAISRRRAWNIRAPSTRAIHPFVGRSPPLIAEHIVLAGVTLDEEE